MQTMQAVDARVIARPATFNKLGRTAARGQRVATVSRRSARLTVRAASEGGFDVETLKKKYTEITYLIPPTVTAAALPVVGLSLLSKAIFGSGLPGPILGGIEGISWLVVPLGAGSFIPRVQEIIKGGDFSQKAVLDILSADPRGDSASERVGKISSVVDPNSPLGMQLQDLEKRKRELESETEEQRITREKKRAELAAMALGVGKKISSSDQAKADEAGGSERMVAQPVTATLAQGMTVENFDVDVTKMSDEEVAKVNLSTPVLKE